MAEQRSQPVSVSRQAAHQLVGVERVAALAVGGCGDPVGEPPRQLLVDLVALDEVHVQGLVAVLRQQQGARRAAVATRAPGLLVVGLERCGHARVDHRPHVGLVHAHPECVGRADDPHLVGQEPALHRRSPLAVEAGVVGDRLLAERRAQLSGQLVRAGPRARIDDRRQGIGSAQGLGNQRALLMPARARDREGDVRPVKAGGHLQRIAQPEPRRDVDRHPRRRGGGGCDNRLRADHARGVGQPEVIGPEVVAPLGDAVGLVDHEQAHAHRGHPLEEPRSREALGRHVEQAQLPRRRPAQDVGVGRAVLLGVDERHPVAQPARAERLDLVLHERHKRRDHDGEVVAQQRRELVAERLARAGGHHHEHVAAGERGLARLALPGAKLREAEQRVEWRRKIHSQVTLAPHPAGVGALLRRCHARARTVARQPNDPAPPAHNGAEGAIDMGSGW